MSRQRATQGLDGIPARVRAAGRRAEGTTASVSDARETETGSTRRGEATVDIAVHDRRAKALFMTVWRPSTRSAENSCGIRQG